MTTRVVGLVALILSGCGGRVVDSGGVVDGGGGPTCPPMAACGGDLSGPWVVSSACGQLRPIEHPNILDPCVEAVLAEDLTTTAPNVIVQFLDGAMSEIGSARVSGVQTFSNACQSASRRPPYDAARCSSVEDGFRSEGYEHVTCGVVPDGCRCSFEGAQAIDERATYLVHGSTLYLTSATATASGPFCVAGDEASLDAVYGGAHHQLHLERRNLP